MLTLQTLRREAYQSWECICCARGVYNPVPYTWEVSKEEAELFPFTNSAFKAEVKQRFGDLRCRSTWETAAIWLLAQAIAQAHLEPYEIVSFMVSADDDPNNPVRQHYGDQVVEAMFQFPEIIHIIREGLEQIYRDRDSHPEERRRVEDFIAQGRSLPGLEGFVDMAA